jgi:hypothetical protein
MKIRRERKKKKKGRRMGEREAQARIHTLNRDF